MNTISKPAPLLRLFLAALAFASLAASFVFSAPNAAAQTQPPPQANQKLAFDVASIKEWEPNQPSPRVTTGIRFSTGSVYAPCVSLKSLVSYAYHLTVAVPPANLPEWANAQCGPNAFSVDATMPLETTQDQSRRMMQSLLENRFKMRVHWEKKEMKVLFLVIGPGGFKGERFDPKNGKMVPLNCPDDDPGCGKSYGSSTMSDFADRLVQSFGIPVIDKTGLTGRYATNYMWAGDTTETSSLPALPTVLREKFGLLLKPETAPVDILVVDHVEKPSPN